MIEKIKNFIEKNSKYIPPIAIFGGFIVDSLTLGRIDKPFGQILLGSYLIILSILIILINLIDAKEIKKLFIKKSRPYIEFVILFLFGNVFSGFTLFYFQSAGSLSNWIFVILMFGFLISTEYFKRHYTRMFLQISIFYFAVFSYLIFLVPILTKKIGTLIFLISGVISLIIFYFYLFVFKKILGEKFENAKSGIFKGVIIVFVLINSLYFLNMIPPVPLSLKEIDVFHYIERSGNNYKVLDEKKSFWSFLGLRENVHIKSGDSLYLFSSVFAPAKLDTEIIHNWQYRDEKGRWIPSSKISFPITGGRDGGYRGFSIRNNLASGIWRVDVKTKKGQIIGRKVFKIIFIDNDQKLIAKTK